MYILFLSLISSLGLAQSEDTQNLSEATTVYQQETIIDFGELGITANSLKPSLQPIFEARRATFNPLISLRKDFQTEMSRSVLQVQ